MFKQEDLPNLEVARLHITSANQAVTSHAAAAAFFPPWSKLRRLDLVHPEWHLLNSFKNSASTLKARTSLTVDFASYSSPLPGFLSTFGQAPPPLKELVLKNWEPSIFTFDGVNLPYLTKVEFKHVCLTACCTYLVAARLPSLNTLLIYEYSQGEVNRISEDFSFPPSSPFPALRTFHLSKTVVSREEYLSDRAREFVQLITPTVRQLHLCGTDDDSLEIWLWSLLKNRSGRKLQLWPSLEHLSVSYNKLTVRRVAFLVAVTEHCPSLKKLVFIIKGKKNFCTFKI